MEDLDGSPQERTAENDPRLARERDLVRDRLASDNLPGLRERVAYILNHYPETRNSDVSLVIRYWQLFNSEYIRGNSITFDALYHATRYDDIRRMRAKVQNQLGLYPASEVVREARRGRRVEKRDEHIINDLPRPSLSVYADESGKNKRFALVGSLWLNDTRAIFSTRRSLEEWCQKEYKGKEFHFSEITKGNLDTYKRFFSFAVSAIGAFAAYKATVVEQTGSKKSPDEVITELYYQTIYEGLRHETACNRISLPRDLDFRKDKEREDDALSLNKLKQDLELRISQAYDGQVRLREFVPLLSQTSPYIQIADLFTPSINRAINEPGSNQKDEFSSHALSVLGIQVVNSGNYPMFNIAGDVTTIHMLDEIKTGKQMPLWQKESRR